jgi:hypothetical protein
MKKNICLLVLSAGLFAACKKQKATPVPEERRYNCVCTTTVTYVDHCGSDTSSNTIDVIATSPEQAAELCRGRGKAESSTYTVSFSNCVVE